MFKKLIKVFALSFLSSARLVAQEVGFLFKEELNGSVFEKIRLNFFLDNAAYINGGLTFVYPIDWFSTTPMINVTLELLAAPFSSSVSYSPIVETHSAASVTIRVLKITDTLVSEAASNEVNVMVYTTGDPGPFPDV